MCKIKLLTKKLLPDILIVQIFLYEILISFEYLHFKILMVFFIKKNHFEGKSLLLATLAVSQLGQLFSTYSSIHYQGNYGEKL